MPTRALLFTDLVDSTRLVERVGDARAGAIWIEHDQRARRLLVQLGGREIDRSDGFFLLFDDVAVAARYALAYQQAMADLPLSARVGIHVGSVELRTNDASDVARGAKSIEVEGLAKPFAARIMALALGGQTLLSAAARAALADSAPKDAEIDGHGHYRLKGIEEPVEVFELGISTSAFTPPPDIDKAYRVVLRDGLWRPLRDVRNNLPAERDVFCGRTRELGALSRRLDAGQRLVTLLGPAGCGKTRFAVRYGRAWLGDWPGGIYFCDLSESSSIDGIHYVVAAALGVPLGKDDASVQIGHALAGRGRCLVILDNFEQVVGIAAATLGRWVDRAGEAAFVVTSRERLHLPGEEVFPIAPLPIEREAIDLFVARARAQRPEFVHGDDNHAAIAEVVRLLDGLPLAIELAAARARVLTPMQIVERLRDRFQLLAGLSGAAARQATLKAAIDWSWQLLAPWEQAALAQASVFERGFTLGAAEAVLDLSQWPHSPPIVDVIQALVDKSLLRVWQSTGAPRRADDELHFGMYLTIHEYALARCRAGGDTALRTAMQRHGSYFARFGTEDAVESLFVHGGVERRRRLTLEIDNLVAACQRAVERGDAGIAVPAFRAVCQVVELRGPFSLGMTLGAKVTAIGGIDEALADTLTIARARTASLAGHVDDAASQLDAVIARARQRQSSEMEGLALGLLGGVNRERGRMDDARSQLVQAVSIHVETGRRRLEGSALGTLAIVDLQLGRYDDARENFEAGLSIAREIGNRRDEGIFCGGLGLVHQYQGRMESARLAFEQGLAIDREVDHPHAEATVLNNLGLMALEEGRIEDAKTLYLDALAIHRAVGNRRSESITLGNLGELQTQLGNPDEARAYFETALRVARETSNRASEGFVLQGLGRLLSNAGRLDEARGLYDAALETLRAVGDRRAEGRLLGDLGELLLRQHRHDEAHASLARGEALLREIDAAGLPDLLCARGLADLAAGDAHRARAALHEAEQACAAMGLGAQSLLGRKLEKLRAALG